MHSCRSCRRTCSSCAMQISSEAKYRSLLRGSLSRLHLHGEHKAQSVHGCPYCYSPGAAGEHMPETK